ncbi:MAG: branched-chain amino acid ABC transporter permease [Hyphomicrobiaceae bacterium]
MEQIIGNLQVLMSVPVLNIGLLIDGLLVGAVFALAAYGLALVWGVMNVKNLAQGDFVIAGGYIAWWLGNHGIHPLFGVPAAFVVMWGFGWIVYVLVIRHVIQRDLFTSLLATFGVAIVMQQGMNLMFGPETQTADAGFPSISMFDGLVNIGIVRFIGFVMAALLALAVVLFMKRSRMGQAIRATSQDARAARVLGIDTDKVYAFTYSLNAAICGAAGALIVMIWVIQPFYGITYSIRSFVIVTAAGFGNLPGVIAAGLGMGVIEQFGGFIFGSLFQQAIVVLLLLVVLAIRQMQQMRVRQVVQ